jgi:ParB-like chromosome segregation protein Spo0J
MQIALADIRPGRFQPRQNFDEEKMVGLAQSIRDQGLINAIIVFKNEDGEHELIAGERRWRATIALALANKGELEMSLDTAVKIVCRSEPAKLIQDYFFLIAHTIKAELADNPDDLSHLHRVSIVDNIQRDDLSPVEVGQALHDLKQEYGYSIRKLADVVGQSKSWVEDRLKMTDLVPEVAEMVAGGNGAGPQLDITLARELARKIPAALQPFIAEHVRSEVARGKNTNELKRLIGDIARFVDPNRWSLSNDFDLPYNPVVYNRARLIRTLLNVTPPDQLARGLLDLKGDGSYYSTNYLSKKVSGVLGSSYDVSHITQKLTGEKDPWQDQAQVQGWACDRCTLNPLVDVLDQRQDLLDTNAPCRKIARFSSPENENITTCQHFIGPEDSEDLVAIVVPYNIHSCLDETSGSTLLKRPLNGEDACYVTSWQDYAHVYNQARIHREQAAQEKEEQQQVQHLKPIAQYWQAQLDGHLGVFRSQLFIHHFQAHACHKCKHFLPSPDGRGAGGEGETPCRFAERPLKNRFDDGPRAPVFGILDHPDGFSVPRCEKFQVRNLPDNIQPLDGIRIGSDNRALILDWFKFLKKTASNYYGDHKFLWGVLAWLPQQNLEKLWDQVGDDGIMMAILQTGVQDIQSLKSYSGPVSLLDPTTGQLTTWTAHRWPQESEVSDDA